MDCAMRSISIKSTPVPISMQITLPWSRLRSPAHSRTVTGTPDLGTCPSVEDCAQKADQNNKRGIFKLREVSFEPLDTPMSETLSDNDDVLYLTALLAESQS